MIAYTYQFTRDPDEALAAAERAYRIATTTYTGTSKHPRVVEGRMLYGRALAEAGQVRVGVTYLASAVTDAAEVFGPSSRMVGFFSLPLVEYELEVGDIEAALEHSRISMAIIAQHSAPESYRYALGLHARGAALLAARNAVEALPDLTRSVETLRRALGPQHLITRAFAADQALALARVGRDGEAQRLIQGLLLRDALSGQTAARLRHVLGVIQRAHREYADALRLQQQALASFPDGTSSVVGRLNVLTEIACNLQALARPAEAVAVLEQALSLSEREQTRMNPDRAEILAGLARARRSLACPERAQPSLRRVRL